VQGFVGIDEKEEEETQWERNPTEKKRNPIKERKEKKKSIVKCEPPIFLFFYYLKHLIKKRYPIPLSLLTHTNWG
jgi:hypothetical protein